MADWEMPDFETPQAFNRDHMEKTTQVLSAATPCNVPSDSPALPHPAGVVHEVASYDPSEPNYYGNGTAAADRKNVYVDVRSSDDPLWIVSRALYSQYAAHGIRLGFFGASRLSKTLVLLRSDSENRALHNPLHKQLHRSMSMIKEEGAVHLVNSAHTRDDCERIMEIWKGVDSETRLLTVSRTDALDWILPDVEFLVVVSREGPAEMGPRWQRMARMAGQKGTYLQIVPSKDWDPQALGGEGDEEGVGSSEDDESTEEESDLGAGLAREAVDAHLHLPPLCRCE